MREENGKRKIHQNWPFCFMKIAFLNIFCRFFIYDVSLLYYVACCCFVFLRILSAIVHFHLTFLPLLLDNVEHGSYGGCNERCSEGHVPNEQTGRLAGHAAHHDDVRKRGKVSRLCLFHPL